MGANSTKRACLPFEDATKRISDDELKRVCETFKRLSGNAPLLPKAAFCAHVLGDGVPAPIAEWLYTACGGTARGIALKDLVCGLVLLTRGRQDEKVRFLFALYANEAGSYVARDDFFGALRTEGVIGADERNAVYHPKMLGLFPPAQDRVTYDHFAAWIQTNRDATVLSRWLLSQNCSVSLSAEQHAEAPTFYQTLAGVTHLDEQDICELEKCFWTLQSGSPTGHLDLNCVRAMVCPPVPLTAAHGLFQALDVNGDGHVDFKELCCGISAACRGPTAERMKFCFKIFDVDRDNTLNTAELAHMIATLTEVALETSHHVTSHEMRQQRRYEFPAAAAADDEDELMVDDSVLVKRHQDDIYESLVRRLDTEGALSQEEFLVWAVEEDGFVEPMLELLFQVCHVSFVLKPHCRHHEHDIVTGWLEREERRGYHIGQFWYLISSEWWRSWLAYTTAPRTNHDHCTCRPQPPSSSTSALLIEEGIVCDESLLSSNGTGDSMESMGDLLIGGGGLGGTRTVGGANSGGGNGGGGDSCSIASSSGVSSSSASSKHQRGGGGLSTTMASHSGGQHHQNKENQNGGGLPGPIDNSTLVAEQSTRVATLTGEGGRLKKDQTLVQKRDFELVPELLWKALAHWYGGPLPLPRQVIVAPPGGHHVELELYPLNLNVLRHQSDRGGGSGGGMTAVTAFNTVVGGYGAAALSTAAGLAMSSSSSSNNSPPRRYLAHTAAFSRLANVRQVVEFLAQRLALRVDDVRLWHVRDTLTSNNNSTAHSSNSSGNVTSMSNESSHNNSGHYNNGSYGKGNSYSGSAISTSNQVLVLLDEDEPLTLQELGVRDGDRILLEVRNKDLTWPEELGALASSQSNVGGGTLQSGERRPTIALPPGATGLQNLGNTCFMNAALQAVSNTRPLTIYFRMGQLYELNCVNPLGTKGMVAKRYAELCRELWSGSKRSIVPLNLRACVTKHAPHLGGGGQHDSQELLAWLLDALHEDLNRVARKHYTELKDSGGRPDEVVAEEAWRQHLARDDSIITDLFYGQLKSKVTCQQCGHESVRFDPFSLLSLPLPMESYVLCEVLVVRLNGDTPMKYGLRLNSEAKYYELKQQLHQLCNIPANRLLLAELASAQIKQVLDDQSRINASIAKELYAYELPADHHCHDNQGGEGAGVHGSEENEYSSGDSAIRNEIEAYPEMSSSSLACSPETKQTTKGSVVSLQTGSSSPASSRRSSTANSATNNRYLSNSSITFTNSDVTELNSTVTHNNSTVIHDRSTVSVTNSSVTKQNSPATSPKTLANSPNSSVTTQNSPVTNRNSPVTNRNSPVTSPNASVANQKQSVTNPNSPGVNKKQSVVDKKTSVTQQNFSVTKQTSPVTNRNSPTKTVSTPNQTPPVTSPNSPVTSRTVTRLPTTCGNFLIAVHRKSVRQDTYFLTQHKSKPSLFGVPLLIGYHANDTTCQTLYEHVWRQVTRLLSPPPPQPDQNNHATDCDDSLGYEFPFQLKAVLQGGQICAVCHWTRFCRGCTLPCGDDLLAARCKGVLLGPGGGGMCIAIDWDPTALHLRYQSSREKLWIEDESVQRCRKLHTEPIDLDYCLRAFTSEERLETKYHCSNCQDKQPATKKLQIWRLPPILIIHLKRFDCVNNRWVKTHKVVNFPFKNFDPTEYLASVPQETILRHRHLAETRRRASGATELSTSMSTVKTYSTEASERDTLLGNESDSGNNNLAKMNQRNKSINHLDDVEGAELDEEDEEKDEEEKTAVTSEEKQNDNGRQVMTDMVKARCAESRVRNRTRLESTSLLKTPIVDEHLKDYHGHKLLPGQNPFDLQYQLYAVVSHSGLLNGGHYISYACNPNGNWYCYNDSSCREVFTEAPSSVIAEKQGSQCAANTTKKQRRIRRRKRKKRILDENEDEEQKRSSETNASASVISSDENEEVQGRCKKGILDEVRNEDEVRASDEVEVIDEVEDEVLDDSEDEEGIDEDDCSGSETAKSDRKSENNNRSTVKIPKIDTSAAYILFYERSGLDYKPYLPDLTEEQLKSQQLVAMATGAAHTGDSDENDSNKQNMCSIQ